MQAGRTAEVEPVDCVNRCDKEVAFGVDGQFEMLITGAVHGDVMPMAVVQIDLRVYLIEDGVGFRRRRTNDDEMQLTVDEFQQEVLIVLRNGDVGRRTEMIESACGYC